MLTVWQVCGGGVCKRVGGEAVVCKWDVLGEGGIIAPGPKLRVPSLTRAFGLAASCCGGGFGRVTVALPPFSARQSRDFLRQTSRARPPSIRGHARLRAVQSIRSLLLSRAFCSTATLTVLPHSPAQQLHSRPDLLAGIRGILFQKPYRGPVT